MILNKKDQENLLIAILEKATHSSEFKRSLIENSYTAIRTEFGQTLNVKDGYRINFKETSEPGISEKIFEEIGRELVIYIPDGNVQGDEELYEEELDLLVGACITGLLERVINEVPVEYQKVKQVIKGWWTS